MCTLITIKEILFEVRFKVKQLCNYFQSHYKIASNIFCNRNVGLLKKKKKMYPNSN